MQSLVRYYESLAEQGKITMQGWCRSMISFAVELSEEGELLRILSLKQEEERGKKKVLVPQVFVVPQKVKRSSNVAPDFLADIPKYILGVDESEKKERLQKCFTAAREKHLDILKNVESKTARAIKNYYETWDLEKATKHPAVAAILEELTPSDNFVFYVDGFFLYRLYANYA